MQSAWWTRCGLVALNDSCSFSPWFADQSEVKCGNAGCEWMGTRKEWSEHQKECKLEMVQCELCSAVMQRGLLFPHGVDDCPKRPVSCEWCADKVKADALAEHKENCLAAPVACSFGCSDVNVTRGNLEQHKTTCAFKPIGCEFASVGCQFIGHAGQQAEHCSESTVKDQHLRLMQTALAQSREKLLEREEKLQVVETRAEAAENRADAAEEKLIEMKKEIVEVKERAAREKEEEIARHERSMEEEREKRKQEIAASKRVGINSPQSRHERARFMEELWQSNEQQARKVLQGGDLVDCVGKLILLESSSHGHFVITTDCYSKWYLAEVMDANEQLVFVHCEI